MANAIVKRSTRKASRNSRSANAGKPAKRVTDNQRIEVQEAEREMEAIAKRRAEREAKEAAGITLNGLRLKQAHHVTAQINFSAAAIHKLAFDADEAISDAERMERYLTGLANIAETICRRCDVLSELLGERGGFGNFADEFEALTEERAVKLEREESEESAVG